MKQELVTLLLVSVMVASAFGAIGLSTTKVEAQAATTLSLSSTRYHPDPGQQYTLSAYLTDSTGGALAGKPIDIWVRHDGDNGKLWKTVTTDSNGKYSTTASSTQKAYIRTVFKGDSAYSGSRSDLVTVTPKQATNLSLDSMNYNPDSGQYTISGYLKDSTGMALAGKPIDIWYRYPGETTGHLWTTVYTGTDGKFSTPAVPTSPVYLRTVFKGDSVYASAYSHLILVNLPTPIVNTVMGWGTNGGEYRFGQSGMPLNRAVPGDSIHAAVWLTGKYANSVTQLSSLCLPTYFFVDGHSVSTIASEYPTPAHYGHEGCFRSGATWL